MFACDAGMGSSAMGASVLRKKIQAAGHGEVTVVNKAISNLDDSYDLVVTHQDLTDRAKAADAVGDPRLGGQLHGQPAVRRDRRADRPVLGRRWGGATRRSRQRWTADVLSARVDRPRRHGAHRDEAITEAGDLLVAAGAVDPSYVDAMHEREKSVSTHMGNGLAIPHGTNEAKGLIRRTAISFVRYDEPVDWNGKPAEFVIGIAGAGDDHLALLSRIAETFIDEDGRRPAARGDDAGRRARRPRRRPGLTLGGSQTGWTVTGTPFNAAFPLTSSRSGSVRSLIETPATVAAWRIRVPATWCP